MTNADESHTAKYAVELSRVFNYPIYYSVEGEYARYYVGINALDDDIVLDDVLDAEVIGE
jgi:hypothetical protein